MIAWPMLVGIAAKTAWTVGKFFAELKSQALRTVQQIDTLSTNHFPHMEASLTKQDGILTDIAKSTASTATSLQVLVTLQGKS